MTTPRIHVGHALTEAQDAAARAQDDAWRRLDAARVAAEERAARAERAAAKPVAPQPKSGRAGRSGQAGGTRKDPPIARSDPKRVGRAEQGGRAEVGRERTAQAVRTTLPPGSVVLSPEEATAVLHLIDTHQDMRGR